MRIQMSLCQVWQA